MKHPHSQALEELFGMRQILDSMGRGNASPIVMPLYGHDDISPAEATQSPEIFSELCR